ncbi:NYN domain-containing protein [Jannaschia sp. 2305UL9-9]|uniref:NYN domain-containing protein n=1 Tax=Jannaschia sp. 2305UL9-9 TaxID=3121638 RepID=UPI00352727D9
MTLPDPFRPSDRVAILVDGENLGPAHHPAIRQQGRAAGHLAVFHVYGNAHQLTGWEGRPGVRVVHSGTGKCATDLLLCVEAMELVLRDGIRSVVLASSDGDFVHLVRALCRLGVTVLGLGEAKTPAAYRTACSTFEQLAPTTEATGGKLDDQILETLKGQSTRTGMTVQAFAQRMKQRHDVSKTDLPEGDWHAYFSNRLNAYTVDPRGPDARVRLLSKTPSPTPA